MREIKFRAWDEQNKIMHHDYYFIKSGESGNDWIIFVSDKQRLGSKPHPLENPYFQQQFKIMQYTGLKDLNGNEIYDGDIVKVSDVDKPLLEVYFDENEASFELRPKTGAYLTGLFTNAFYKVVGNIYENPELLK